MILTKKNTLIFLGMLISFQLFGQTRISYKKIYAILLGVSVFVVSSCSLQRRIERILEGFGVNARNIEFSIVEKTEQWCPNGDGEFFARLSFPSASEVDKFRREMIGNGAKPLPVRKKDLYVGVRFNILDYENGWYIVQVHGRHNKYRNLVDNFCYLIFDENTNEAIINIDVR